jgi:hypothetical protein
VIDALAARSGRREELEVSGERWDESDDAPPVGGPAWGGGPAAGSAPGGPAPSDGGTREVISGGAPSADGPGAAGGPAWGPPAGSSPYGSPAQGGSGYGGGFAPPGYAVGNESMGHSLVMRPPPRRRRGLVVAGVLVGVLALGGVATVGFSAAQGLFGGGDQPEQHLPSTAVAMAKLDLNPSAGQKIDAIRFARKFPQGKDLKEDGDPRQWMWEKLTKDVEGAPSWDRASAWVGNRAALAVLPDPADPGKPQVVGVLAVSDEKKALADMGSLKNAGVAAADGWLLVAESTTAAEAALKAAESSPLADNATFGEDLGRLGEDGVVAGWYDGAGVSKIIASVASTQSLGGVSGCAGADKPAAFGAVSGHGAFALRFSGADLEVFGTAVGARTQVSGAGTGVESLPDGTLGAFGFAGVGPAITSQWDATLQQIADATCEDPQALLGPAEDFLGLTLPGDLAALVGERTAVAVGGPDELGIPSVGLKVSSSAKNLPQVLRKVRTAVDDAGFPVTITAVDGGYVAGTSEEEAAALEAAGALGSAAGFAAAVPDAGKASFVAYADVAGLLAAYGDAMPAADKADFAPLKSFGMTVVTTPDGASTLRMRLTTG